VPSVDDVRRVAATLPGAEERLSGGGCAWFVRRNPFVWESQPWPSTPEEVRAIVASEPCLGVVLPGLEERRALLFGWPEAFLSSGRETGTITVVVRLGAVDAEHLSELVIDAWRTRAPRYLVAAYEAS